MGNTVTSVPIKDTIDLKDLVTQYSSFSFSPSQMSTVSCRFSSRRPHTYRSSRPPSTRMGRQRLAHPLLPPMPFLVLTMIRWIVPVSLSMRMTMLSLARPLPIWTALSRSTIPQTTSWRSSSVSPIPYLIFRRSSSNQCLSIHHPLQLFQPLQSLQPRWRPGVLEICLSLPWSTFAIR